MTTNDHPSGTPVPPAAIEGAVRGEHVRAANEIKRGERNIALKRYRRILCADPGDGIALRNAVWLAASSESEPDLAMKIGPWALLQNQGNARTKFLMGRAFFWAGRIGDAIPLLGATIDDGPDPRRAFSMLGEAVSLRRDVSGNPSLGGLVPAPVGQRLVAFTRDTVSIDHFLPVVWRWSQNQGRDAVVVIIGPMPTADWRIEVIRSMDRVHVRNLTDLDPDLNADRVTESLLRRATSGIVVFDKSNTVLARILGAAARRHGAPFVALPHGEEALTNVLVKPRDTRFSVDAAPEEDLYDLSVHSSRFMVEKWGLKTGPSLKVLGSARYCREWLAKLRDWIPDAPGLPSGPGLRLVLFLPKPDFIVDWVELEQVMSFLAALPETVFVVKAHPRRGGRHRLVRRGEDWDMEITELAGRDAVERFSAESGEGKWISAPPETESSSLVKWADAVLSLGTSVTWQAVAENKPVLELSWCHGNFTTMAKYLPSTDLRCRDDLLNTLGQIRNAESRSFYRPGEREAFIESFIEADGQADDGTVLDAYDTVLGQLCASRSSGATGG